MKKYKDLYEKVKQRHEEALQRYQEDHTDEMKIINLHQKCKKKARKVSQPKKALSISDEPRKASKSFKSDEPTKVSGPIDDPSEEEQKPKKAVGKKTATKAGKKAPKSPEFIDSSEESEEEEGPAQDDQNKKIPPFLGVKKEAQSFFDLQKDSKNLTIEKKMEKAVFMA